MWPEIRKYLYQFDSAVITGLDARNYPFSVRCRPYPDKSGDEVLRLALPADTPIRPGPASLLCHRHDENLWNLMSFLVRGSLVHDVGGWSFEPIRFVPGVGIGGLPAMIRFFVGSRRNAARYLEKRGLARPRIPWDEINAVKKDAFAPSAISSQPRIKSRRLTADSFFTTPRASRPRVAVHPSRRSRRRVPRPA